MSHTVLTVAISREAHGSMRKRIAATLKKYGEEFPSGTPYIKIDGAARALSRLPGVDRVVATVIFETHAGVWRAGRRSV